MYRKIAPLSLALMILVTAMAAAGSEPGDPVRGRQVAQTCGACHGLDGRGTADVFPNIAGQKAGYMVKALQEMRFSARLRNETDEDEDYVRQKRRDENPSLVYTARSNEAMDPFMIDLGDQDIADVAAYYAGLSCRIDPGALPPSPPPVIARCAICHGNRGISRNRMFPNLAGQKSAYMERQLYRLREAGKAVGGLSTVRRRSRIMATQAASLSTVEIKALSAFYAALPCK